MPGLFRACILVVCFLLPISARSSGAGDVAIDGFAFSPAILTVDKATEVTWTNKDSVSHSVVFGPASTKSPTMSKGQTFSHRFDQAGTFAYVCGVHAYMKGQVVVK